MKLLIADTLTLTKENVVYGHYSKTAKQFYDILSTEYDVKIAGGKTYKYYFDKKILHTLPFCISKNEFDSTKLRTKARRLIKSTINILAVLLSDAEMVIFQDCSQILLYKILRIFPTRKRIVLIKYAVDEREKANKAFFTIKDKIQGMITSIDAVKEYYKVNTLIVPDYFPEEEYPVHMNLDNRYVFLVVGTVMPEKDYEMIMKAVSNSPYSLLIAGYFPDKKYKESLQKYKGDNITIVDKYLTDEEYNQYIISSQYVTLPYKKGYNLKSSGVVLDALYRGVPVITPRLASFRFVESNNLGLCYDENIRELFPMTDQRDELVKNVKCFTLSQRNDKKKLISFIRGICKCG